jgi:hypothetical protein
MTAAPDRFGVAEKLIVLKGRGFSRAVNAKYSMWL